MKGVWVRHPAEGAPVVAFVHGVLSSGETCWKHADGGFWPEIVADDPMLPGVGVYVFDYKTGFFSGDYSLGDAVAALREQLNLDGVVTPGGLVFVCHSMGGIVVRRYLVSRAADLIEAGVPIALFLVASPSLGAHYANLLAPFARQLRHSQAAALRFSQSNTWLNDLDADFVDLREKRRLRLRGKELVEDTPLRLRRWLVLTRVVEPFSGARYFGNPIKIPNSDHFSIAKIPDTDALQHRLLQRFIIDWRTGLDTAPADASSGRAGGSAGVVPPPALKVEVSFVINLSAGVQPDDAAGLERLQDAIRTAAGSPLITITEARPGSLLLFVSDPDGVLAQADLKLLRERLLATTGAELVGLVSAEEYAARAELMRELDRASIELLGWPTALPDGERLERPELTQLTGRISGEISSTTAVIGAAGSGKSALLATVSRFYADAGWPMLAIKADLIEPDVVSEEILKERLGLSRLPSAALRDLARFGPVLLVIDQLDALAGHLDVKTRRLSVMLNLVRMVGGMENVHIVLSSRPFEFQHDVRLRNAGAESLQLELPPWEDVLAVLEAHGIPAAGWPADAREVMRSPQALATYLQLDRHPHGQPFTSYQLMLERLWSERLLDGGHGGALDRLASEVADVMAEQESLWLARARFADRSAELDALIAAGILKAVDASIGFSHQTIFEFALARGQAREPGLLSRLVRARQSSLFLRPKMWAALTYLRGADRELYHGEVEAIWRSDLRPHLRALLIDFLGSQGDPTDREAVLMDAALTGEQTRLRAFGAVTGSAGWFERLADTRVSPAMTGDDRLANAQVGLLTEALRTAPAKVAELVRRRWLPEPGNDLRTWAVIQWSSPWTEDALEIATQVIPRTDIAIATIDHQAATAAVEQPAAALRLVRAKLDSDLNRAVSKRVEGEKASPDGGSDADAVGRRMLERLRDPVRNMVERGDDWDGLAGIAETWPMEAIRALWPWFMAALSELERTSASDRYIGYALGYEADFRFEGESNMGLPEGAVLGALRLAVEGMADRDPEAFRRWAAENDPVALTPVQRLIAHGIAHRPQTFAAEGLAFAVSDEQRYFLGSIHDMHGTIKRMVAAVSPFWSPEQLETFEARVRAFAPPPPAAKTDPKERMGWRHMVRQTQVELLRSLPRHRRSQAAEREVQEGERRYGLQARGASFSGLQSIGSIMEAGGMARAGDNDIVNAFAGLPDAVGWDNPRRRMAGGNVQLAQSFGEFAKTNAARAMRVLERLDPSNGVRAAAYALDALAEAGNSAAVTRIARDVLSRGFDGEELRYSISRVLDRLALRGAPVEDDLLAWLERWLRDPLPRGSQNESSTEGDLDDGGHVGNPAPAGDEDGPAAEEAGLELSSLWGHGGIGGGYPGGSLPVADALVSIRLARGEADQATATLSRFLEREKGIRQWEVLSRHLLRLDGAAGGSGETLIEAVLSEVPGAVGSRIFAQFLADAQQAHGGLVESHLDRWRDGDGVAARQAYGELVGLDALLRPERDDARRRFDELTDHGGPADAQVGAALTAAHLLAEEPDRRVEASRALVALLALPNLAVWPAAFEFFRLADRLVPDEGTVAFLQAVAKGVHRSGSVDPTFVVDGLATMLPHEAALVGEIALALTEKWNAELADMRTATARATSSLVDLAVTLHRLGPETRDIGLRIFEQLIDIDAYEARQTLNEIDGRFLETPLRPRRPRLRRRSQVLPRRRRWANATS